MLRSQHLLGQRAYWPVFWTMFFGALNDNIFKNAIVILITYQSFHLLGAGPQEMVAFCAGIFILPFFLFSAYAGIMADKFSKSQLIYYIKWWEVGTMMLGALALYWQHLPLLLFTLFLMGSQSAFFGPTKYSILPELLPNHQLLLANGWMGMGTFVAILMGTVLGAQLVSMGEGPGHTLVAGLVIVAVALIGTWSARQIPSLAAANGNLVLGRRLIQPTWKILQITFQRPQIGRVVLAISWFWCLGSALLSILPNYCKDVVGGNQDVVSLFLGLFSVGVGVGSLLCRRISGERLDLGVVPLSALGMGLCLLDLYLVGGRIAPPTFEHLELRGISNVLQTGWGWRIVIDLLLFAMLGGIYAIPLNTIIQQETPLGSRSQVVAGNNILNALAMVLASGLLMVYFALGQSVVEGFGMLAALNTLVVGGLFCALPHHSWRFASVVLAHCFYRITVEGQEHLPTSGPVIFFTQRARWTDRILLAVVYHRPMRFFSSHHHAGRESVLREGAVAWMLLDGAESFHLAPCPQFFVQIKTVSSPLGRRRVRVLIGPGVSSLERALALD